MAKTKVVGLVDKNICGGHESGCGGLSPKQHGCGCHGGCNSSCIHKPGEPNKLKAARELYEVLVKRKLLMGSKH